MSFESQEAAGAPPLELYEFTQGTSVWRYTSADEAVPYGGQSYTPAEIVRGKESGSGEDSDGELEVRLPRTDAVAALFIGPMPATPVTLTVRRGHRGDLNWSLRFTGEVVSASYDKDSGLATLVCAATSRFLEQQTPGYYYQWPCGHVLFGPGCDLDPADYRVSGTVTAVDGLSVSAAAFEGYADGYFSAGWVQDASGRRRFVTGHVGDTLTLSEPLPALTVGATLYAYPGCDGFETTCAAKFDNLINHLGFGRIPTRNPFLQAL